MLGRDDDRLLVGRHAVEQAVFRKRGSAAQAWRCVVVGELEVFGMAQRGKVPI